MLRAEMHKGGKVTEAWLRLPEDRLEVVVDGKTALSILKRRCILAFPEKCNGCAELSVEGEDGLFFFVPSVSSSEELRLWLREEISLQKNRSFAFVLLVAALATLAFAAWRLSLPGVHFASGYVARLIPRAWEAPLADIALRQLRQRGVCLGKPGLRVLYALAEPLIRHAGLPKGAVKIIIVTGDAVNLFSLPGGVIVVESGALARIAEPDALAAGLARELIHIRERHPLQRLIAKAGTYSVSLALVPFLTATEPAVILAGKMVRSEYDASLEDGANREATELLRRSGFSPHGTAWLLKASSVSAALPEGTPPPRRFNEEQRRALAQVCDETAL
jgi:hypothetical protein